MTRLIDCQLIDPPFTILQALYYISALAADHGHLVETDDEGNPVVIGLANSKYPYPAPSVTGVESASPTQPSTAATFVYPLPPGTHYNLLPYDFCQGILLEPWKYENCCGGKSFRGTLMPERQPVIAKLWDGYKFASDIRDNEVQIYMTIQSLWGKVTPQLICSADVDFCVGIILEEIKVLSF